MNAKQISNLSKHQPVVVTVWNIPANAKFISQVNQAGFVKLQFNDGLEIAVHRTYIHVVCPLCKCQIVNTAMAVDLNNDDHTFIAHSACALKALFTSPIFA